MAAPVTIAGRDYVCQIVVKQFKDRNQFYLHEVELKEKLPTEGRTGFYFGSTSGGANVLLAQKTEKVNTLWKECSKVVDENGEPLVVYHGSPHYGFTVFDKARRGERDIIMWRLIYASFSSTQYMLETTRTGKRVLTLLQ